MKRVGAKGIVIISSVFGCVVFAALIVGFVFLSISSGISTTLVNSGPEEQQSRISPGKYDEYGMVARSKIILVIGNSTETLDISTISDWIILEPLEKDLYQYKTDNDKIKAYVRTLAEKYNTFVPFFEFVTSYGETVSIVNQSTGWIMDEDYAAKRIAELSLEGNTVTICLTDGTEESKNWWVRIMGEYGAKTDYGNSYAEVSISDQYMWLYLNGKRVLESPVVTGNPNMGNDTPTGAFSVTDKIRDATLYGPGYETIVDYWVGFTYAVGFHDARWQESFGGNQYLTNGSHGCVNVPTYVAEQIFQKAYVGMPVFVY